MATHIAVPLTPKSNIAIFLLGDSRTAEPALIENQEETPREDDTEWSDVSSVTSCAWPASSLAESIASLADRTEGNKNAIEIATYAEIADNLWDDEYRDTRLIHARAGHTKHAKKSQRRYKNLGLPSNIDDAYCHERVIERKPWKINHFPAGYLPEKICQYRLEKLEGQARRALEDDVKMRDITPKPTKKGNWM